MQASVPVCRPLPLALNLMVNEAHTESAVLSCFTSRCCSICLEQERLSVGLKNMKQHEEALRQKGVYIPLSTQVHIHPRLYIKPLFISRQI